MKKFKVKHRKLRKEKADGRALSNIISAIEAPSIKVIELSADIKGFELFCALTHEALHHALPTTHEEEVLRIEKEIATMIWSELKKHPEKYK